MAEPSRESRVAQLAFVSGVAAACALLPALIVATRPGLSRFLPGFDLAPWLLGIAGLVAPAALGATALALGTYASRRLRAAAPGHARSGRAHAAIVIGAFTLVAAGVAAAAWVPQIADAARARMRSMDGRTDADLAVRVAHADPVVRLAAVCALKERRAAVGAAALAVALGDPDLRAEAEAALAAIGRGAAAALVEACAARDPRVVEAARRALREITWGSGGGSAVHDALAAGLRAADPRRRWGAAFACAGVPGYSCPDLTPLVGDPDRAVRFAAACVLLATRHADTARQVPRSSLPALVLALGPNPVAVVAGEANDVVDTVFRALPSLGLTVQADDQLLRGALASPALRVPALAHLLETREIRTYLPEILACLTDPLARWHAARLLVQDSGADPKVVVPALVSALLDASPETVTGRTPTDGRSARTGHETEIGCLLDALRRTMYPHPDPSEAVRPLLERGDREIGMAFAESLCEAEWGHRRVVRALVVPWLIDALHRGPLERRRAVAALRDVTPLGPDVLDRLEQLAADETETEEVRTAAREVLRDR